MFSAIAWIVNRWFFIWFLIEIRFLFFVRFAFLNKTHSLSEFMIKYFIVQVFFSLVFLIFIILYSVNLFINAGLLVLLFLSLKLGLFPFYFWLIIVLGKLGWMLFVVVSGLMKVIPIIIYFYTRRFQEFRLIIIGSLAVGSVGGINNCCIQKLLGYSSMIHLSWIIYGLETRVFVFWFYFLRYLFIISWLRAVLNKIGVFFISQFKINGNFDIIILVFLYGISLAGFPPFLGFLIKWVVLNFAWLLNFKFLVRVIVFLAALRCYFYLQLYFYVILIYRLGCKWGSLTLNGLRFIRFFLVFCYLIMFFVW